MLHSVIDAEPAIEELRPMLGVLAELGVEAERPFQPDQAPAGLLTEVARVGRDQMLVSAFASYRSDRLAWPDRTWEWVGLWPQNRDFERPSSLDVEARDRWFAEAIVASPAKFRRAVGQGSLYWLAHRDRSGGYLDGSRTNRLEVPLPVPATLFWAGPSAIAFRAALPGWIVRRRAVLRSRTATGGRRPMGTDGPRAGWFAYFRIYGPENSDFDGSWRPGDFEQVESSISKLST